MKLFSQGRDAGFYKHATSVRNLLGDLIEQVCPHPEYKLMTLKNIPQMSEKSLAYSTYTWAGLLKHLRQMLIADASMEEGAVCVFVFFFFFVFSWEGKRGDN